MARIITPTIHSTKQVFNFYKELYPDSKIKYWLFKEVIARIAKKASDAVIMGGVFNLGNNLGYIKIKKIKRNWKKLVPDWGTSIRTKNQLIAEGKRPKSKDFPEGELWMVYFSDPWYLRWGWVKKGVCRTKNQSVYEFKPTTNRSKKAGEQNLDKLGNTGKLALANKLNPVLHQSYVYE